MKKHFFIYAFAALFMGGFVASCSDDDPEIDIPEKPEPKPDPEPEPEPEPVVCPIKDGSIFLDGKGLNLKYSGTPLIGKQVKFVTNASDATKATLVLSAAGQMESKAFSLPITGNSGVVPGEKLTNLNVNLKINGSTVTFEGTDENAERTITYKGEGTKDALSLELNVAMSNNELTNKKFALQPFKEGKTAPIVLKWDSEGKLPLFGTIQPVLDMVAGIGFPMEGAKEPYTINEMLAGVLNQITFLPDGNIQAKFRENPVAGEWQDSPLNMATYRLDTEKKVALIYINVPQIMAYEAAKPKSRAGESNLSSVLTELLGKALNVANTMLTEGIPVSYEVKDGVTTFFLDEKIVLPLLQLVKPVLENEEVVNLLINMIVEQVGKLDPNLAAQLPVLVKPIISAIPDVIDKTKSIRLGLNLVPATAEKK